MTWRSPHQLYWEPPQPPPSRINQWLIKGWLRNRSVVVTVTRVQPYLHNGGKYVFMLTSPWFHVRKTEVDGHRRPGKAFALAREWARMQFLTPLEQLAEVAEKGT